MSSTGFWSTILVLSLLIVVDVINGRPIRSGRDVARTFEWSSANAVDDQTYEQDDNTRSAPEYDDGGIQAYDTRQFADRDVKHAVAEAPAVRDFFPGIMNPPVKAMTGEPFFEDYTSGKSCGMCGDRFGDLDWTTLLNIFLITVAAMIGLVIVYWTVISCCMMRRDSQDCSCTCCSNRKEQSELLSRTDNALTSEILIEEYHS